MRILVLTLLLLAPLAAGQTVELHGSDDAALRVPVEMAYTIQDGDSLAGHINVDITIARNGTTILETTSVHEHEGVFPFLFTPTAIGTYTVTASSSASTATHDVQVTGEQPDGGGWDVGYTSSGGIYEINSNSHPVFLVDVQDPSGRVIASSVQRTDQSFVQQPDGADIDIFLSLFEDQAQATSYGSFQTSLFMFDFGPNPFTPAFEALQAAQDAIATNLGLGQVPTCGPDVAVNWDPTGADPADGSPLFQEYSDIRLSWLDSGRHDLVYRLADGGQVLAGMSGTGFTGAASFLPPATGPLDLVIGTKDDVECIIPFDVIDNPIDMPGRVVPTITQSDPQGASIHLEAVSDEFGVLTHYEFETRIVRDDPLWPTMDMVWQGKLHGHAGNVTMNLSDLSPGNYTVQVLGSPQDFDAPHVLPSDGSDIWTFNIEPAAEPAAEKSTPWPAPALMGLLLVAMARRMGRQ